MTKTPERAAKAFKFLTSGHDEDIQEIINGALFESANNGMVVVKDIEFYSTCEHHIMPFHGVAHVGYLPEGHVIGLSKIPRIVDHLPEGAPNSRKPDFTDCPFIVKEDPSN